MVMAAVRAAATSGVGVELETLVVGVPAPQPAKATTDMAQIRMRRWPFGPEPVRFMLVEQRQGLLVTKPTDWPRARPLSLVARARCFADCATLRGARSGRHGG